ncbi:MAG TPA: S41 family peptidase [Prolixibacteraceae bacterium]
MDSISQSHSVIVLSSLVTNQVLDLSRGSQENNATVGIYEWNGGGNQYWTIEKVEKAYMIRSCFSKKVLAVNSENSLLVQQDFTGNDNQLWAISGDIDSASIMNKSLHKNLVFKTNKIVFDNDPTAAGQQWQFKSLQTIQEELVSCNCTENFEFIKHLMETSYAGFQDKVNPETKAAYGQLCTVSAEKAKGTSNTATCFKTIKNYLWFFNDNHVQFSMNHASYFQYVEKKDNDLIRHFYAGSESLLISENEVRTYFESNKNSKDPLEGIWESVGGNYRCAIIGDKTDSKHFLAVILKSDSIYWMPGQVKMDIQKQADNGYSLFYASQDHSLMAERNINIIGDTLYEWNGKWVKRYPRNPQVTHQKIPAPRQNASDFELKSLDESTLLLSLPSFDPSNKSRVDKLMDSNRDKLLHCPYLIIDVRGNGGGSDETFNSILPYLYTHPFEIVGNDILSSKENIAAYESRLAMAGGNNEWMQSIIQRMKEYPGQFVTFFDGGTVRYTEVMPNPRKIGILINNNCASSAEQFLLLAKESKKVKLFGQPTSGTLDYSNLIKVEKCPSSAFQFGYATTKTRRLPFYSVDKEKIKPDFYLTDDENWIQSAVKQLKAN